MIHKDTYVDFSKLTTDFWDNVKLNGGDVKVTLSDTVTKVPVELKSFTDIDEV